MLFNSLEFAFFFRASNLHEAIVIIKNIFSKSLFSIPHYNGMGNSIIVFFFIFMFIIIEWKGRESEYGIEKFGFSWPQTVRHTFYTSLLLIIFWFSGREEQFIYFQF